MTSSQNSYCAATATAADDLSTFNIVPVLCVNNLFSERYEFNTAAIKILHHIINK